jgi:hypothetical protein
MPFKNKLHVPRSVAHPASNDPKLEGVLPYRNRNRDREAKSNVEMIQGSVGVSDGRSLRCDEFEMSEAASSFSKSSPTIHLYSGEELRLKMGNIVALGTERGLGLLKDSMMAKAGVGVGYVVEMAEEE